jgi:hypothetical protein
MWVAEVADTTGTNVSWQAVPLLFSKDNWHENKIVIEFSGPVRKNQFVKIYSWNKSRKKIFIDEILIRFLGFTQRDTKE